MKFFHRLIPLALLLTIVLSSCAPAAPVEPTLTSTPEPTSTPNPTPTTTAIPTKKIAFNYNETGTWYIYTMHTDGSGIQRVSANEAVEGTFDYSPDRQYIVFESFLDSVGNSEIYRMNADGTNVVQLTNRSQNDWNPIYSPDGTKILFTSGMSEKNYDLFVMNADGSNVINLSNNPGLDVYAVWSPDGTRIAYDSSPIFNEDEIFTSDSSSPSYIKVINADGTGRINLPMPEGVTRPTHPQWSPDGSQIVFSCGSTAQETPNAEGIIDIGNYQGICVAIADGSNVSKIYEVKVEIDVIDVLYYPSPVWSPDGTKIAYIGLLEDGSTEVFTMNPDGSAITQITNDDLEKKREIIWSPDGTMMLFLTYEGSILHRLYSVYSIFADGSNTTPLIQTVRYSSWPIWIDK